jgi:DNA-binding IclR family transcriptional regulator
MRQGRVVKRIVQILRCFEAEPTGLGVSQISDQLGIAKSVVHGDLEILVKERFLAKRAGKYSLGVEFFRLASVFGNTTLRQVAYPVMKNLAQISGETVSLADLTNRAPCCIEVVTSVQPLKVTLNIGEIYPLHAGSAGKIMLAFLPGKERERILKSIELVKYTENTIVKKSELLGRLREVRENGYALSVEERHVGLTTVGAPIFDSHGRAIACISIGAPSFRLEAKKADFVSLVRGAAEEISSNIKVLR